MIFENYLRHILILWAKGPIESRKWTTCSLVLPFRPSYFWNLGTSHSEGMVSQLLQRDKVTFDLEKMMKIGFFLLI